jgi:hypothetical protein
MALLRIAVPLLIVPPSQYHITAQFQRHQKEGTMDVTAENIKWNLTVGLLQFSAAGRK